MASGTDTGSTNSQPSKGGAPSDPIWKFFIKRGIPDKTTNRRDCVCTLCPQLFKQARLDSLRSHILSKCPGATPEIKAQVDEVLAKKAAEVKAPTGRKSLKRQAAQSAITESVDTRRTGKAEELRLNFQLLRIIVTSGASFALADNPWLIQFLHDLRPSYTPASKSS